MQTITIIDMSGNKIGNTYPKRAKQLIRNQKAKWLDEEQTKIMLYELPTENESSSEGMDNNIASLIEENMLYKAAAKIVDTKRKLIIIHFALYAFCLYVIYTLNETRAFGYDIAFTIPFTCLSTILLLLHWAYRNALHEMLPFIMKQIKRFQSEKRHESILREIEKMQSHEAPLH